MAHELLMQHFYSYEDFENWIDGTWPGCAALPFLLRFQKLDRLLDRL